MSTNASIAVKTNNGYKTIYCHWDGYPSYMMPMLQNNYNTEELAIALVDYGDASSISEKLLPTEMSHSFDRPQENVCVFYHRDRGEPWECTAPCMYSKEEVLGTQYFVYIFEDGEWHAYENRKEIFGYDD